MNLINIFLHGGPLDGYKKLLGGILVLTSQGLTLFQPDSSLIQPLSQAGNFLLGYGILSDLSKRSVK